MTRGAYNEKLPDWLQELASISEVNIDSNPENYSSGSIYSLEYKSNKYILEERSGSKEGIAILLSGDDEEFGDLVEQAGLYLDKDKGPRSVVTE